MRKLGEQWIEEIDWHRHLVKLSKSSFKEIGSCGGCIYHSWHESDWCDVAPSKPCGEVGFIIKDLGILNEDGCLPSSWGGYPTIEAPSCLPDLWCVWAFLSKDGQVIKQEVAWGETEQEAIDAWNRRA